MYVCVWLQVFGAQAVALAAELGPGPGLAAPLPLEGERPGRPGVGLQCGHHAPAARSLHPLLLLITISINYS